MHTFHTLRSVTHMELSRFPTYKMDHYGQASPSDRARNCTGLWRVYQMEFSGIYRMDENSL